MISRAYTALLTSPLLSVHVATLLFGLAGVLGATVGLDAFEVTFGRTLFASIALVIVCCGLGTSLTLQLRSGSLLLLLFSGLLLALHWVTFFASIQLSTVAIGLVMFSTCPVFVALLEPLFFKEKLSLSTLFAALMVLLGVIVISGVTSGEVVFIDGLLLGLASGFSFACLQLLNRRLTNTSGALVTSTIQNSVATIALLPFVLPGLANIELHQWGLLMILGVACTALAHTLFIGALKKVRVSTASLIAAGLEPIYGALLAAIILFQQPAANVIVGGAIILCTVLVVTVKRRTVE